MSFPSLGCFLLLILSSSAVSPNSTTHPPYDPPAPLRFEDWHCGNNTSNRRELYSMTKDECSPFLFTWSHCCAIHDECYMRQLGQSKCDDDFCVCSRKTLKGYNLPNCSMYVEMACAFLPYFGGSSYETSTNHTESIDAMRHEPVGRLVEYDQLYKRCQLSDLSLSSCALMYNYCAESEHANCSSELCGCIRNIGEIAGSVECFKQTNSTCKLLLEEPKPAINIFSHIINMIMRTRIAAFNFAQWTLHWLARNVHTLVCDLLIVIIVLVMVMRLGKPLKSSTAKNDDYITFNI